MCGIAGIIGSGYDHEVIMDHMLDQIAHRGPDAKTSTVLGEAMLGHRRLSIIDLNTGDQPIYNEDRSMCIIYNGEIYNYRSLRDQLRQNGILFSTESDTEVVLKAYEQYGDRCVNMLNGIFAFAIYDVREKSLFLARDHFGIKPLHYCHKDGIFIFASEQKAILKHPAVSRQLNIEALHIHLNLRYTQGSSTLFSGIKRLPPGHHMTYKGGVISIRKYWQLDIQPDVEMTEGQAIEGLQYHIKEAVRGQLVSDVPIGVYLSGGLDSSTLVQKMHELGVGEINTFTLGFNEPTDEFSDARQIAGHFDTNHREMSLSLDPLSEMEQVIWHAEEPKINLLQGYNMSKFVSPHVKVVLGGLGGDELFAGYDIHKFIRPFDRWHQRVPQWLQRLLRWKSDFIFKIQHASGILKWDEYRRGMQMLLAIGNIERYYLIIRNVWDYDMPFYQDVYSERFLRYQGDNIKATHKQFDSIFDEVKHLGALDQVLGVEFLSKMVNDYLLVDDRMSMAHGVEERVPFLDRDLVAFGFKIPVHLKIKNGQTKYLFRKAMSSYLPERIIKKKKWGFTVNPYLQFKKDLKQRVERELTKDFIERQGIFNHAYIKSICDYPAHPRLRWHYNFLWLVLGLKIWQEQFGVDTQVDI